MLALIERIVATIERFLALHHTIFERANLALTLLVLGLGSLLILDDLFLCLKQSLFLRVSAWRFASPIRDSACA
mgnify:CR=1 FL=1